ncbi:MAG TPA: SRPBCC domain-containing protein [Candidatus Saccharimonadia bacterium]|nr:SRPBCC domain-containing protein [Candidatus Saccharimonadia bacterium]
MAEKLVIERTIDAGTERVWRALTDIKDLKQWLPFFPDFKAEVGFETEFELGPKDGQKYHHVVEVLEVEEGKRLTYSWDYGGMSDGSSVTFELEADGDKTKLVLTCDFASVPADVPDFMKNAQEGWNYTADGLKKFSESNS